VFLLICRFYETKQIIMFFEYLYHYFPLFSAMKCRDYLFFIAYIWAQHELEMDKFS